MEYRTPSRRISHDEERPERRAPTRRQGLLRVLDVLRNLWVRPLGLRRQGYGVKVVLVDRRRTPSPDAPPPLSQVRAELRERLLGHKLAHAAQVMRHLAVVHDELGRSGWAGVEALPAQVLGMAVVQAEMLASEGPSRSMALIVERLRIFKVAADVRREREARARTTVPAVADVLDVAAEALPKDAGFDEDGRSWAGPVPVPLVVRGGNR